MEDILPIGSKIRLKDGRVLMIIGYLPSKPNDEILYDYICSISKNGIIRKKEKLELNKDYCYIKKDDIKDVLYIGYHDEEYEDFKKFASSVINNLNSVKLENRTLEQEDLTKVYIKSLEETYRKHGDNDEK